MSSLAPKFRSSGGRSAQAGFTLVELLGVIGIIAIIIALLLPALAASRHQANVVRWKAYLHQLEAEPEVVAVYDFQVDNADMPADGNGNINNPSLVLENKAIGNPSDVLSTVPSYLNGVFAGTLAGASASQNPTWVQGRWKGKEALNFKASANQYVDCGRARDWSRISSGLTIAAWYRPTDSSTSGVIVGREYGPTHVSPWFSWLMYAQSGLSLQMRTDNSAATSGQPMRLNDWNHLVVTYGQAGTGPSRFINLYQDDLKTNYSGAGNNVIPSVQTVRIGAGGGSSVSNASPPNPLQGQIDEIVIFNIVMPDYSQPFVQEIDKLYTVGQAARQ